MKTAFKPQRKIHAHTEYDFQVAVCDYLRGKYPKALFLSDTVAAIKLRPAQALRNKKIQKSSFKCPDLLILEPRGTKHGLFLELKPETPFRKDGVIKASQNDHLAGQELTLWALQNRGYVAEFVWTFEQATELIDDYLAGRL